MGEATETKTPGRESQGLEKDLRRKISNLEATVARLTIERDDLSRDVETLCLDDSSNTTFNVSSVLNERIFVAEKQVFTLRKQLLESDIERKSLQEDLYSIKDVQQTNKELLKKQQNEIEKLSKEVSFYREQATRAISDRDAMSWEIESLRKGLEDAQEQARTTSSSLAATEEERDVLRQRLDESKTMVKRLEKVAATAELLPLLQRDVRSLEEKTLHLETEVADLTNEKDLLRERLEREQAREAEETHIAAQSHEKEVAGLHNRIQTLEAELENAMTQLASVTSQKVQALMDKANGESALSKLTQELSSARQEMSMLKANLETATREKVQALIDRADIEAHLSGSTSKASSVSPSPFTSPMKKRPET